MAASFQLVSGLVNFLLLPMILIAGADVCATMTYGLGGFCGLGACVIAPIGALEIGAALLGFAEPRIGHRYMRMVTWAEVAAIFVGSAHSAIIGHLVARLLEERDVVRYLELPPPEAEED